MSRVEIPIVTMVRGGTSRGTQVTADSVNKHVIHGMSTGMFLEIESTDGTPRTVSIEASPDFTTDGLTVNPEIITVPAGGVVWCAPFKTATFRQNEDKDMYVDPEVSTTLKFRVGLVPPVSG